MQQMTTAPPDPGSNWARLRADVNIFADRLTAALQVLGILNECRGLDIDHICVRLKNTADVDELKQEISAAGQIVSSTQVNGREISIIQLNEPLAIGGWSTSGIELPYPKPSHAYEDGWEHVEFVLSGVENTMPGVRNAFIKAFPNLLLETLRARYFYSEDAPQAANDQMSNPTIAFKVNGVGLKFHAKPIQEIVGHSR